MRKITLGDGVNLITGDVEGSWVLTQQMHPDSDRIEVIGLEPETARRLAMYLGGRCEPVAPPGERQLRALVRAAADELETEGRDDSARWYRAQAGQWDDDEDMEPTDPRGTPLPSDIVRGGVSPPKGPTFAYRLAARRAALICLRHWRRWQRNDSEPPDPRELAREILKIVPGTKDGPELDAALVAMTPEDPDAPPLSNVIRAWEQKRSGQ